MGNPNPNSINESSDAVDAGARERVMFLPGPILPAAAQFGNLLAALGNSVDALPKEYEVHRGESPPDHYGIETEVEGISRAADERRWQGFHLVGYSAGGSLALAFAAAHPDRVRSLALIEPGEIGHGRLGLEDPEFGDYEKIMDLPPEQGMKQFVCLAVAPGVEMPSPPPGMPPPWEMRPKDSLIAFSRASLDYEFDESRLEAVKAPVFFALGSLSHPRFARLAEALGDLMPNFRVETYQGSHHLNPPFQSDPERFAAALWGLWREA